MITLNINDRAFAHQPCSIQGGVSDKIKWVHDGSGDPRLWFYTNHNLFDNFVGGSNIKRIGWLTEPRTIIPEVYQHINEISKRFDLILSNDDDVLRLPNAKWIHGGGSYVGIPMHGDGEEKIYQKTKLCSIISSDKMMCPLHIMRKETALFLKNSNVDTFGSFDGNQNWVPIMDTLRDYAYTIIFENNICNSYWTEKLNNAFLTGTIPIYLGAMEIHNFFDKNGIIKFYTKEKLIERLKNISFDDYYSRMDSIKYNFEEAKKYRIMEDYICNNYIKEYL